MAKKEWRETPVEELTDEELKRGFQRLRELYRGEKNHVHEIKIERGKLREERFSLLHEIKVLKRENRLLAEKIEKMEKIKEKEEKKRKPSNDKKVEEKSDFKKRFLDSL